MKTPIITLFAGIAVFSMIPRAYCFNYDKSDGDAVTWASDSLTLYPHNAGFSTSSKFRMALSEAVQAWNHNPSKFQFSLTFGGADSTKLGNGRSEVLWVDTSYWESLFPGLDHALATTWKKSRSGEIKECDIHFDAYHSWTSSDTQSDLQTYGGEKYSFQATAIHELGHVMGLNHEDSTYNCMGLGQGHMNANNTNVVLYPGEDACNGAVFLYGLDSQKREDVSVTHRQYGGEYGEYSTTKRDNIIGNLSDTVAEHRAGTFYDPNYEVRVGAIVQLWLTFENNGASSHPDLKVNYYLSSDPNIQTSDTLVTSRTMGLNRNVVYTTPQNIVIPGHLIKGKTYYLGARVDPDNAISEVREDNNATYVGIYIK